MYDISRKIETFRTAKASSVIKLKPSSLDLIKKDLVPKGNVLETARTAGYLAVKKTSELIPLCHPLPIEWSKIEFKLDEDKIIVECEVRTTYKTGCEMEALFGASCAALCIYDMMKPVDADIEIVSTKLLEKKGGKSDFTDKSARTFTSAVLVISDTVSKGGKEDKSGKLISEKLKQFNVAVAEYNVIPDEIEMIRREVNRLCEQKIDLIITTGGTGLSKRDVTPEAILPLLDCEVPGIMEAARSYGQKRTPYSMLSRGVAGVKNGTVILTLPGSSRGAEESMDALFPYLLHIYKILAGRRHD